MVMAIGCVLRRAALDDVARQMPAECGVFHHTACVTIIAAPGWWHIRRWIVRCRAVNVAKRGGFLTRVRRPAATVADRTRRTAGEC